MKDYNERRDTVNDLVAKTVFRNKRLLAELFGYLTDEFRGMEPEDIEKCIVCDDDGDPIDFNTELFDPNIGSVRLDTIAEAIVPDGSNSRVRILFNLEMQAHIEAKYSIHHRAQMYAAMMLATQNKVSVGDDKYTNLKRCYSVWVCPKSSREMAGKVFAYGMLPKTEETESSFSSLMEIVMVYPGQSSENEERSVTDMLGLVFSPGLDSGRCQELLDKKYHIGIDLSSLESVKMTDWYAEGEIAGRIRKSAEDIVAVMKEFGCSLEKALAVMDVSEQDKAQVLELVKEMQNPS